MVPSDLTALRRRFVFTVAVSLPLIAVAGGALAIWVHGIATRDLTGTSTFWQWTILVASWWLASLTHFLRTTRRATENLDSEATADLREQAAQRLSRLPRHYGGWLLAYILVAPALASLTITTDPGALAGIALAHLLSAGLLGVAPYLYLSSLSGRMLASSTLTRIYLSVENKLMLFGVMIPLLTGLTLMYYYWWRTAVLNPEVLLVWSGLGFISVITAAVGIRDITLALKPVRNLTELHRETLDHKTLAALRPASGDEIGYLTQTAADLGRWLIAQEQQVRALVDTAAEGIVVVDELGQIITFNPAAEQLFGYSADSVSGQPIATLLPGLVTLSGEVMHSSDEQETLGLHRSGRQIAMAVRVSVMTIGGKTLHTLLIADISPRKQAQEQLREAEARYRELVESAHDVVWSMDEHLHWTYLNPAAANIYAVPPAEMLGRSVQEFQAPKQIEHERGALARALAGETQVAYETTHLDHHEQPKHLSIIAKPRRDSEGRIIGVSGITRDITARKDYEEKLSHQATHDALTSLFNRRYFLQELERMLARVTRGGAGAALMYVDLDQLKFINDALGHAAGDRLLVESAQVMKTHIREGDLLARYGGDEFTVLLYNVDLDGARRVAENLRARFFEHKFIEEGNIYDLTLSVGLCMINASTTSSKACLEQAERACGRAKTLGRNQVASDEGDEVHTQVSDAAWSERVRRLIDAERVELVYQPIVAVTSGGVYDYEVLARLIDEQGEMVAPGAFMPTAERLGLASQLDRIITTKAINHLAELREAGLPLRFSINLTVHALKDDELLPLIRDRLRHHQLNAAALTFEIKETAAITDLAAASAFVLAIKGMGANVALDQFGFGFSSFTYLRHLPVDKLKIDGSYIQSLPQSVVNQTVVRSMNQVAHALGKLTVAEHVENKEVMSLLRELGVDYAQGYLVGKPEADISKERFLMH